MPVQFGHVFRTKNATEFMSPSEAELLALRLARMKQLIDDLERECSNSAEQREKFRQLKQELKKAGRTVQPPNVPRRNESE